MKISLPVLLIILLFQTSFAQNFTGQWKGSFTDKSSSFVGWGGNKCEYIIDLDCKDRVVSGYSYTYFNEGGKRFYTICRLKGSFDKGSKSVEITEVERTKTNVPNNIRNCFQVHRLTYFKQGEDEILEGSWVPAPKQEGDCGYGTTTLNKRILKKNATLFNNSSALSSKPAPNNKPKTTTPPVVRSIPQNSPTPLKVKPVIPDNAKVQTPKITANNELPKMDHNPAVNKEVAKGFDFQFEKRNNTLIRTIEIENETFRVDLYDNGEIDGDSISPDLQRETPVRP
ncbi:MAG: hypothetical protein IPI66_15065 [Chitinophagaceae bacterium]|nr:hypothetical protein [Chitinophagaceae bacterium]